MVADRAIALSSGGWNALAAPGLGGSLLALTKDGYSILRPNAEAALAAGEVRRSGCFPMAPYCNRIGWGRFSYAGAAYQLAPDLAGDPHSLHGLAWRRPWSVVEVAEGRCVLELVHRPAGAEAADWPFAFTLRQTFTLGADGFIATLALTNDHPGRAPAGLGLHPLFRRRAGERIRFASDHAWVNDEVMLPKRAISGTPFDYGAGRVLDARPVDNDFSRWRGSARFEAPGEPSITLRADPVFGTLRLFAPPDRDFFAVEPMTHETNAFNRPGDAAPMADLAPGETLEGRVFIDVEASA